MQDDYKQCCKGVYSKDEVKALILAECFDFGPEESHKKLYENKENNIEFLSQVYEENEKVKEKMKEKLTKLFIEGKQKNPKVIIGKGNSCNNDCYLYNLGLTKTCPKCDGKVEEDYENDYTIEKKWDDYQKAFKDVKNYNEKKICTGFKWNNNISKCDVNLKEMFNYFDKKDPEKKTHYSIVVEDPTTKAKKTEEYDVEHHYMMLDGERFDFPLGLTMQEFFFINNEFFIPKRGTSYAGDSNDYSERTPFWYEGQPDRAEIGQSLGYYGYAWKHMVLIYTCNLCGYKYHIIKTSPFAFRDKSKDAK